MNNNKRIHRHEVIDLDRAAKLLQLKMSGIDLIYYLYELGIIDFQAIPYPEYQNLGYMYFVKAFYPGRTERPTIPNFPYFTREGLTWFKTFLITQK